MRALVVALAWLAWIVCAAPITLIGYWLLPLWTVLALLSFLTVGAVVVTRTVLRKRELSS